MDGPSSADAVAISSPTTPTGGNTLAGTSLDAPVAIPARHGRRLSEARRIGRLLRHVAGTGAEPDPDRWRWLGERLMRGDAPMDRLVDWMVEDMRPRRALFEQAVERGIATVADAPSPLKDFFETYETRPSWVDMAAVERGAEFGRMVGNVGSWVLRDGALMGGYQSPGLNRVLVLTGALEKGAAKRLAETADWWLDCTDAGGLERGAPGYKATLRVRLIHALVRRHVGARPDWDPVIDGVPINQMDMAATQLAFSVVFLTGMRAMGCPVGGRDAKSVIQLVRYAGWLMGVDLALQPETEREGLTLLYQMLLSLVDHSDESGKGLSRALADEPLTRPYKYFGWLRQRFARERNLSINLFFLGRRGMANLGLPKRWVPWFPMLAAPVNFARFSLGARSPASRARMAKRGRTAQRAWVRDLTGRLRHKVGEGLGDDHPAAATAKG